MKKLLKLEWLKIRRYRAFMWLMGVFAVSLFGVNYIVSLGSDMVGETAGPASGMLIGNIFDFPMVWQTVTYFSSYLLFIPGLIIILLTANEYSFRTHRQSVINGLSRRQFMAGKAALLAVFSAAVTVFVFCVACYFGLRGNRPFSVKGMEYPGYFFLQSLTYMSAGLVLVMIFKRSGITTGIYFLYCFILKNMFAAILSHKLEAGIGNYLPVKSADKLIPAPTAIGSAMDIFPAETGHMVTASVIWLVLMVWFCFYRFEKSDI